MPIVETDRPVFKELVLHGLAAFNLLNKELHQTRFEFTDLLGDLGEKDEEVDD